MAFIDLTNVEITDEVSSDAKVLIVEDDEVKRTAIPDLSKVEVVEEVSEDAKMLVEDGGKIVRTNALSTNASNLFIIEYNNDTNSKDKTFAEVVDAFLAGKNIYFKYASSGMMEPLSGVNTGNDGLIDDFTFGNRTTLFSDDVVYID